MSHQHQHAEKNLKIAFFLNIGFAILEVFGGLYVNSVAIISDAVHDFGDSLSIGISWILQKTSKKDPDSKYSFGYSRFSLLGAVINSFVLIIGSVFVVNEAVSRLIAPEKSNAQGMIVFAIIGVVVNGYAAWKLRKGSSLNERVVSWHLIEDVLGWLAILIGATVLVFKDVPYLDPILSLIITLFILWNVVKRLKESAVIFLQKIPDNINPLEIENRILEIEQVDSLHHTHIWSLEGENHVYTTHVRLKNVNHLIELITIKEKLKRVLNEYPFQSFTIETELDEETCAILEREKLREGHHRDGN